MFFVPTDTRNLRVVTPRQWNPHRHKYCIIKSYFVQSKSSFYAPPGLKFPSIGPRAKFYFAWVIFGGVAGSTRRGGGNNKKHYFYNPHLPLRVLLRRRRTLFSGIKNGRFRARTYTFTNPLHPHWHKDEQRVRVFVRGLDNCWRKWVLHFHLEFFTFDLARNIHKEFHVKRHRERCIAIIFDI